MRSLQHLGENHSIFQKRDRSIPILWVSFQQNTMKKMLFVENIFDLEKKTSSSPSKLVSSPRNSFMCGKRSTCAGDEVSRGFLEVWLTLLFLGALSPSSSASSLDSVSSCFLVEISLTKLSRE